MSMRDCINDGFKEGNLTESQRDQALSLFDELENTHLNRGGMGASVKAARDTFDVLKRQAIETKRRKLLQIKNWQQITKNLEEYRDGSGNRNIFRAAEAIFDRDENSKFSDVVGRQKIVERAATAKLSEVLATFKRDVLGRTRQKAKLNNVVLEIFGKDTGDASAKEMAKAWSEAAEYLRLRFNQAGGQISNRQDWGMPQSHNMLEIRKAGYLQWKDYIKGRLDKKKMIDDETGLEFTDETLEKALIQVYKTITTDGFNKINPGGVGQGKSIASRHTDHRFLVFKTPEDWVAYQKKFGNDNSFDVMFGHISAMSKDIAMLEILGPNPKATLNFLKTTLSKEAAMSPDVKMRGKANKTNGKLDVFYDHITGTNNSPIDGNIASVLAGTRQLLQSSQLGSAFISAIVDANYGRMARAMVGMPQTKALTSYLKMMNPLTLKEKGKLAVRMGLTAEGWSTLASAQMRYVGDISGPEITRRIADFVMRASFLSPWTQAGRWSFGMEMMGFMADNADKAFKDLPAPLKNTLDRFGIREQNWEIIRKTPLHDENGVKFLRFLDIEARTDIDPSVARELTNRMMELLEYETNFAVPSSSMRGEVMLKGNTKPGTFIGEISRSFAMYKNFGVTLMNTHLMRGINQKGALKKSAWAANFFISTTLMGMMAMQLKEMSKGRDPVSMLDKDGNPNIKTWGAAFLQGGGFGIFGDFLFNDVNRLGGGISQTIAGPVAGLGEDILKLSVGNIMEYAQGKDTNIASELIRFAGRYTPGSSLWYLRLALERNVLDQATLFADPKGYRKMRQKIRKYSRNRGQDYWWRPGRTSPDRGPNLEKLLEN